MTGIIQISFNNTTTKVYTALDSRGFISLDGGIETLVFESLFTDKRARDSDKEPDKRGWWGDNHSLVQGDKIGSWIWLLRREPDSVETTRKFQLYAEACLEWLVEDGIATEIVVEATSKPNKVLSLNVQVTPPVGSKWSKIWEVPRSAIFQTNP